MKENKTIRILAESAVCVAIAVVLSIIPMPKMPFGGKITLFSTLPIIVISLRHGVKWGIGSALVFSLLQLMLGFGEVLAVPVRNIENMMICAFLDFVLAYTLLGFAGPLTRKFGGGRKALCAAVSVIGLGRLTCSFISGVIVWAPYAPEGWGAIAYSLAYNVSWCLPDTAIVLVACLALWRVRALDLLPSR